MIQLPPLKKKTSINLADEEKTIQFTGAGMLIGSLGSKDQFFTNKSGVEKAYRLATVKVNIPKIGEKNLLLQIHESNLKYMAGLKKEDEWESEDQKEDAIEAFESGKTYRTTVRPVRKTDGFGFTLLGNMSHELYNYDLEKFLGVYRFIDFNDYQEYFLIILNSTKALLLYKKSKEIINRENILRLYEESYETLEDMAIGFNDKKNESSLNLFSLMNLGSDFIGFNSNYNKLFGLNTYQCLRIEASYHRNSDSNTLPSLIVDMYSIHKETLNGKENQKTKTMSKVLFSKIL
ncbi:hypothetical protein [Nonlabens sp. Asnod3-A02]|uniref:hypothetical protein n=1 Tax=Nonlabens sp. Asnod3-A02 TaxID=3160579 RepID=UPI00386F999D